MNRELEDETEINFSDESLADCLELLVRIIPTAMPEWMD